MVQWGAAIVLVGLNGTHISHCVWTSGYNTWSMTLLCGDSLQHAAHIWTSNVKQFGSSAKRFGFYAGQLGSPILHGGPVANGELFFNIYRIKEVMPIRKCSCLVPKSGVMNGIVSYIITSFQRPKILLPNCPEHALRISNLKKNADCFSLFFPLSFLIYFLNWSSFPALSVYRLKNGHF